MIDTKIWALGAIKISVDVADWRGDRITPSTYICRIEHRASDPAITATRPSALEAEREAVARFIEFWEARQQRKTHLGRTVDRKIAAGEKPVKPEPVKRSAATTKAKPAPKPPVDDFDY